MTNDSRFIPGVSGNVAAQWKPGRSGNPAGRSKARIQFEAAFQQALTGKTSANEAATLLVGAARAKQAWAIRELTKWVRKENPEQWSSILGTALASRDVAPCRVASTRDRGRASGPALDLNAPSFTSPDHGHVAFPPGAALSSPAATPPLAAMTSANTSSVQERSPVLFGNTKTAGEAEASGFPARASDGSSIPHWRDFNVPRSPAARREFAATVQAETAPSPLRPGRAVASPTSPTPPSPRLLPRLDSNERTKGSALYRLTNQANRPTNTKELGRYIVIDDGKRSSFANWCNNRARRK